MKKIFIVFLLLFTFSSSFAQNFSQYQALGYQESPTVIKAQTADSNGNVYWYGSFRGQLTIKGQNILNGNGGDDLFLAKTDADGNLLWAKNYGSALNDVPNYYDGNLNCYGNKVIFSSIVSTPTNYDSVSITPLASASTTWCMVQTDTTGKVSWVKKTNMAILRSFYHNNVLHFITQGPGIGVAAELDGAAIIAPANYKYLADVMLDTTGTLLNYKLIKGSGLNISSIHSFDSSHLLLLLRTNGDSTVYVNNQAVPLGSTSAFIIVKTDTSYTNVTTKVINNSFNTLVPTNLATFSFPLTTVNDSVYFIVNYSGNNSLNLDGVSIPARNRNVFVVLDKNLHYSRSVDLGSSFIGTNPRQLYFKALTALGNYLFFNGYYHGSNESPNAVIPVKDSMVSIIPSFTTFINLNGASKSFILKTDVGLNTTAFKWLGDHSPYEQYRLDVSFFKAQNSMLYFSHGIDNVWNPWILTTDLDVVQGSMKPNADRAESTVGIGSFSDGSRLIVGYARGKMYDDSATSFTSNGARQDVFFAKVSIQGTVQWVKRFEASLTYGSVLKFMMKGNKGYFLLQYSGSVNEQNYFKVDSTVTLTSNFEKLLGSIDQSGKTEFFNLTGSTVNNPLPLNDFDFLSNGNMVVLSDRTTYQLPLPGTSFPNLDGFYLLQVNPKMQLVGAVKCYHYFTTVFYPHSIATGAQDKIYLSGHTISNTAATQKVYMHDGTKDLNSIVYTHPYISGVLGNAYNVTQLSFNGFNWYKGCTSPNGQFGNNNKDLVSMNDNVYCLFRHTNSQPLSWDGETLSTDTTFSNILLKLDNSGKKQAMKLLPDGLNIMNFKKGNTSLYLSGFSPIPLTLDTISIKNGGGSDALALVLDSNLKAANAFRLSSIYNEYMTDFDVYQDSLVSFAFTAQTTPAFSTARISNNPADLDENAFVASTSIKSSYTLDFFLAQQQNKINLSWQVRNEGDIKTYKLQRSEDNSNFTGIEERTAGGQAFATYAYTDELTKSGTFYYRIAIEEKDGKQTYTKTLKAEYSTTGNFAFYFNALSSLLNVYAPNADQNYTWSLFDMQGNLITKGNAKGNTKIPVKLTGSGKYILSLMEDTGKKTTFSFLKN